MGWNAAWKKQSCYDFYIKVGGCWNGRLAGLGIFWGWYFLYSIEITAFIGIPTT
jgi:hypothetical protein